MGKVRKFQCSNCKGIVENTFEESSVLCGHCDSVCTMPEEIGPGVVIDDFLILKLLGQGGMGNVYLAHEFTLDREVALKILKDSFMSNEEHKLDFIQEARSVASLNDPNIMQAYKVGEENGIVFFVSEYVEGKNLKDTLKETGPMNVTELLPIAIGVVSALDYAWETRKLVHRDIKPENIMLNQKGVAKLMDLGLSLRDGYEVDEGDQIKGTPQYISPDQIIGAELDNRTDFYCLGATLYHLVSGRQPFEGDLQTIIQSHLEKKPESLKKIVPGINEQFAKIIHKLMAKMPEDRYQSSQALLSSLKKLQKAIEDEEHGKKHFRINAKSENKLHSPPTEHIQVKKKNVQKVAIIAMLSVLALLFSSLIFLKGKPDNSRTAAKSEDNIKSVTKDWESNSRSKKTSAKEEAQRVSKTTYDKSSSQNNTVLASPVKVDKKKVESKQSAPSISNTATVLIAEADAVAKEGVFEGKLSEMAPGNARNKSAKRVYIRFDMSSIQKSVKSAKFRLFVNRKSYMQLGEFKNDSWDESTGIGKINKDDFKMISHIFNNNRDGGYITVDVTEVVNKEISGDKKITFSMGYRKGSGIERIMSREHSNKDYHPRLILETE